MSNSTTTPLSKDILLHLQTDQPTGPWCPVLAKEGTQTKQSPADTLRAPDSNSAASPSHFSVLKATKSQASLVHSKPLKDSSQLFSSQGCAACQIPHGRCTRYWWCCRRFTVVLSCSFIAYAFQYLSARFPFENLPDLFIGSKQTFQ